MLDLDMERTTPFRAADVLSAHYVAPDGAAPRGKRLVRHLVVKRRTLEPRLEASPYLAAGRFTAADVSVGYSLMLAEVLKLSARFTPAIAAYWQRLSQRPAFLSALQVQQRAAREQGVPVGSSAA